MQSSMAIFSLILVVPLKIAVTGMPVTRKMKLVLSGYWTISCLPDMDGTSTIIQNRARLSGIIEVDLKNSELKWGQKFQIRNVLNLYNQPVVESTYNEEPIAIPMMKSAIVPDFGVFLVIPEESFTSFVARVDEL